MRVFTTLLATLASLAVVSATTDAADTLPAHVDLAAVASPGEDIPSADSNSFVVGQRSLEKRTLCAKDSDCNLVAHVLPLLYPNGAQCVKWLCVPKCGDLWDWDIFSHKCRDVSSDNENCGKCGQKCELDGASETTCRQGRCIATCCKPGYSLGDGVCHLNPSQQAYPHHKRSKVEPRKKLCPEANESACPILGSSTYGEAVKHLAHAGNQLSGVMLGAGGYECIDTTQALDSCGGCASTGEGVDCTKIRGARSVGCENSACRVFSCKAGFKPSPRGDKCVRARASAGIAKNATAHAAHKGLAAVREAHS